MNENQQCNLHTAANALRERPEQHCNWTLKMEEPNGQTRHCAWGMVFDAVRPGQWTRGPRVGAQVPEDDQGRPCETYTELNNLFQRLFGITTSDGVEPPLDGEEFPPTVIQLSERGPKHWARIADWMDDLGDGATTPQPSRKPPKGGATE